MNHKKILKILIIFLFAFVFGCNPVENSSESGSPPSIDDDDSETDDDSFSNDNDDDNNDNNDNSNETAFPELTRLNNGLIEVKIDSKTGHITEINDLTKTPPLALIDPAIDPGEPAPPFQIKEYDPLIGKDGEKDLICSPQYPPQISLCGFHCRTITWQCGSKNAFEATVILVDEMPVAQFKAKTDITTDTPIFSVTYPVFAPLAHLAADHEKETMAIPYEGGMEFRNPLMRIREEQFDTGDRLHEMTFPDGHDMMIQMISYQAPGKGGFLIYTPDTNYTTKVYRLISKTPTSLNPGVLATVEHINWDVNQNMVLDYPVTVSALSNGTWQEAAALYRDWAKQQIWTQAPIAERQPEDRALFERSAFCVFGISSREDQAEWYRTFHDDVLTGIDNAQVLFVPGWDFHPNGELLGGDLLAFYQGGYRQQDWLPFQGDFVTNYQTLKQNSDFTYPFFYDLLVNDGFPTWDGWEGTPAGSGDPGAPWDRYEVLSEYGIPGGLHKTFPGFEGKTHTLCAANQDVQDFYVWRNRLLLETNQDETDILLDGLYHDISYTVMAHGCYNENHDHGQVGSGRWLVEAIREINDQLIGDEATRSFSIGAENVTEPYWDQIDFYHLGDIGVGPIRGRNPRSAPDNPEFHGLHKWIMDGDGWEIPLTSFVYHAYGGMRAGGKIQISYEMGDLFYWICASEYLWGGILELIYFNTPMDLLPGIDPDAVSCPDGYPCAFQTTWGDPDHDWKYSTLHEADPDKLEFLRKASYLRTTAAVDYLASGEMVPPPTLDPAPETVGYSYDFYSHILGADYEHYGTFNAPAVVIQAWQTWNTGQTAFVLANATDTPREITLTFDPADYNLLQTTPTKVDVYPPLIADQPLATCSSKQECVVTLTLEEISFGMVELR